MREQLDKYRPLFEEGGRFAKFFPIFEATETFVLTSGAVTKGAAHIRDALDTKRYMVMVIVALLPTVFMGAWNAGYQHNLAFGESTGFFSSMIVGLWYTLPIIIVSYTVGGIWEVLFAVVRKHEINEGFLVTGLLFPLTLPPNIPLWQVAVGISFGVVIGKEVFGGTGMNIFNPALTARAFVFFAFPAFISGDQVWIANYMGNSEQAVQGISGATPLLAVASGDLGAKATSVLAGIHQAHDLMNYSWWNCFIGFIPGSIGETSTVACLIGAAILISTGIGSWRTIVGCLVGMIAMSMVLNSFAGPGRNPMLSLPPYWHFVVGSFAFGSVYMATDPVSGSVTDVGKWIYGILIGIVCVLIRCVNPAYPEGMMLAILLMNIFATTIDHFVVQQNIRQRRLAHAG
ncbi:NADH:ubiquinone reductase (Na(+)-transporting) subunit B [Planctomycetes bacterium Pan216]|uniref:NADH:ubiquinone reductase (Na(+)-transporting) subunit B n=1 Tax=Kolteria novifilia TaxID=2527975 RepID=UPI0011A01337